MYDDMKRTYMLILFISFVANGYTAVLLDPSTSQIYLNSTNQLERIDSPLSSSGVFSLSTHLTLAPTPSEDEENLFSLHQAQTSPVAEEESEIEPTRVAEPSTILLIAMGILFLFVSKNLRLQLAYLSGRNGKKITHR